MTKPFGARSEYHHLYDTRRWRNGRKRHLAAQPLCVDCTKRKRTTPACIVDHKIPHKGDERLFFDESNWQSLCKLCHDSHKQRIEKSGVSVGCDDAGLPIDPRHHWHRPGGRSKVQKRRL